MSGISTPALLAIVAVLVVVVGAIGFVLVSRRSTPRVPGQSGHRVSRWLSRLIPSPSDESPNDEADYILPEPWLDLVRLGLLVLVLSCVLGGIVFIVTKNVLLAGITSLFSTVGLLIIARLYDVLITLEEGDIVNVNRWSTYRRTLFALRGHVMLSREMKNLLNQFSDLLKTKYATGEVVAYEPILAKLRPVVRIRNQPTAVPEVNIGHDMEKAARKLVDLVRSQQRFASIVGGLRVAGIIWVDKVDRFSYETVTISKVVQEDGTTRFIETRETKIRSRLLLTDVTKSFVLRDLETAPMRLDGTELANGLGFHINIWQNFIVRVIHPYKARYRTREGWMQILQSLAMPIEMAIIRETPPDQVSRLYVKISRRIMLGLNGSVTRWKYLDDGITIDDIEILPVDTTINHVETLRERYGLEIINAPLQDAETTKPEDTIVLEQPSRSRMERAAKIITAEGDATVTRTIGTANAAVLKQFMEAASTDPETARQKIAADAVQKAPPGTTVIMNMGSGGGKPEIDTGMQVLITQVSRLARELELDRKASKDKKRPKAVADDADDEEEEEEKA